jgi:hypothetical protein
MDCTTKGEVMADRPWKVFERKTAALFGTTRKLMKGTGEISDIGGDDPDFPLILDCKLRKRNAWHVIAWLKKVEEAARASTGNLKWPVLCIREPGTGTKPSFAVVRREPFMKFIVERVYLPVETYFVKELPSSRFTRILAEWNSFTKEVKRHKERTGIKPLIPMLIFHNTTYDIEIAVLKPEDLALIFREGGILKQEETKDEEI